MNTLTRTRAERKTPTRGAISTPVRTRKIAFLPQAGRCNTELEIKLQSELKRSRIIC
jgi:hypothetical protein